MKDEELGCKIRKWEESDGVNAPPVCGWLPRTEKPHERHDHIRLNHTPSAAQWTFAYEKIQKAAAAVKAKASRT